MSDRINQDKLVYVNEIQQIAAVEQILATVSAITGLGFVAVAHVTANSWTTCAVLDKLNFGLKIGDGLDVTTTLCEEVRAENKAIMIDHVRENARYCDHHTPRIYGFQSYFSIPLYRTDGAYFGTLCGLDPQPAGLSTPAITSTLHLFAELISKQLEAERVHAGVRNELRDERETAELREQFIAVLGHDLRTPLGAIEMGIEVLRLKHPDPTAMPLLQRMQRSAGRMSALVDDLVDFTRGRMGGGILLTMRHERSLEVPLNQVIDELRELHPDRTINATMPASISQFCDAGRMSQLLSNLLNNALVHGAPDEPVSVLIENAEDGLSLAVVNQGPDMPRELLAQLFKPFWRAPSTGTHQGLGLGLYIVSEIARSHGGEMHVTSIAGKIQFKFSVGARPHGIAPYLN